VPAVNQVELHPYFIQRDLRAANARYGIITQAWSPIGGIFINHPKDPNSVIYLLRDPGIVAMASKYGRTPAQIVLRWHIQNGVAAILKSVHAERIAGNIDVFDFELAVADMAAMDALDRNLRGGTDPEIFDMDFIRARATRITP
jgi:diketogulonate reductase-like aldo/keto reductase